MSKRAHFIGIAGMGMSATAVLLKEQGWIVSGSDMHAYPPGTTQLKKHGIAYATRYDPAHIPKSADLVVVGMNAKLARENNTEVQAAYESGVRIISFPEIIAEITKSRETIVVAGSYGKSTITSLMAWCLSRSGIDAGWFIGAPPDRMEPAHLGTHAVFTIEGDEYPTSHADPRPKFSHYRAHDALITSAAHDHANIYKTHEAYLSALRTLAVGIPKDGLLVLSRDEPHAAALAKDAIVRVIEYGTTSASDWYATNVVHRDTTTFDLMRHKEKVATLSTSLFGDHNVQNIVGASAMLLEKKLLSPARLAKAIGSFKGLARRLDKKTATSTIPAYEAFGSSREKLRAAIRALKTRYPKKRLVVVFEPHTFSWRNKTMLHWYDDAFEGASLVVLYKPAEQGTSTHEQSSQEEMAKRLSKTGILVRPTTTPDEAKKVLADEIRDSDIILLSSSGAMDGLIEEIPKWLDNTF